MPQSKKQLHDLLEIARDATEPAVELIDHRVGVPSAHVSDGVTLSPGSGSWMFNSIETRARDGLSPTHVPRAHAQHVSRDMYTEASEVTTVRSESDKSTIPPEFKHILLTSKDYKLSLIHI